MKALTTSGISKPTVKTVPMIGNFLHTLPKPFNAPPAFAQKLAVLPAFAAAILAALIPAFGFVTNDLAKLVMLCQTVFLVPAFKRSFLSAVKPALPFSIG